MSIRFGNTRGGGAIRLAAALAWLLATQFSWTQESAVGNAVAALERGDYSSAEQILHARLLLHPKDGEALSVLGVVLDQEKKYSEADEVYHRALANSPLEPALLNNFGNHLIASGKLAEARQAFLQVIGMDAANNNALVQLARIALERKSAAEALGYLDRIPAGTPDRQDAAILRMQAGYQLGKQREANAILARLSDAAGNNPPQSFALGVALASVAQYEKAETFFAKTLEAEPANFDALYDLGLAASHAGHNERARSVLQQALAQQPENVDVLYDLAAVNVALDAKEAALALLAKAARLSPQRTDVLQLEARTSAALGYFADAARTWDQYLMLAPADEVAHRERAFVQTATGEKMSEGLGELNSFVRKHPGDAVGHYELGTAETPTQPDEALKHLNQALALKPDLTAAHVARGLLLYRQGKTEAALTDFQFVAKEEPSNETILDRLGETYMAVNRAGDAVPPLRKAAELSPANSTVLLHLGRALSKIGQQQEAAVVFARYRELGLNHTAAANPPGFVEFLGLSPEEQRARYRAGVEHTVREFPANAEAQVRYLAILTDDANVDGAAAVVRTLCTLQLEELWLTEAVGTLLASGQYYLAKQLLDHEESVAPLKLSPELRVDLAVADFHVTGVQAGLDALNRVSASERNGDYYLARAEILEAQDRRVDAELCIQQAIRRNPTRPELYRHAALLLIKDQHIPEALELLGQASRTVPNNPEVLLLRTLTLELAGRQTTVDQEFKELKNRWPEWYKVWIGNALVLEARKQPQAAERMRQMAVAMGAPGSMVGLGRQVPFTTRELASVVPSLFP